MPPGRYNRPLPFKPGWIPRGDLMQAIEGHADGIRRAVATDAAALAEFAARSFVDAFAPFNRPEDMDAHVAASYGYGRQLLELRDPAMVTLIADGGASLRAYAQVRPATPPAGIVAAQPIELRRFYVDRPAHGTGLAQSLMRAVRDAALEFGGRHLWLGVWENNPRAIAFYAKQGFIDVGSTYFDVGSDRQTDRVMVAAL